MQRQRSSTPNQLEPLQRTTPSVGIVPGLLEPLPQLTDGTPSKTKSFASEALSPSFSSPAIGTVYSPEPELRKTRWRGNDEESEHEATRVLRNSASASTLRRRRDISKAGARNEPDATYLLPYSDGYRVAVFFVCNAAFLCSYGLQF